MDASRLRPSPLFAPLSDDELERVATLFQETEILAGSGLAREGDFAYKFFVVLDGEVDVMRGFEPVAKLGPGDFFGEMGVMTDERRNARVQARTRCDLAWMMAWDFKTMADQHPSVAEILEETIAERMASLPQSDGEG